MILPLIIGTSIFVVKERCKNSNIHLCKQTTVQNYKPFFSKNVADNDIGFHEKLSNSNIDLNSWYYFLNFLPYHFSNKCLSLDRNVYLSHRVRLISMICL
ncbi:hypothetical protein QTP88_023008 [Uroleucon formosanum]